MTVWFSRGQKSLPMLNYTSNGSMRLRDANPSHGFSEFSAECDKILIFSSYEHVNMTCEQRQQLQVKCKERKTMAVCRCRIVSLTTAPRCCLIKSKIRFTRKACELKSNRSKSTISEWRNRWWRMTRDFASNYFSTVLFTYSTFKRTMANSWITIVTSTLNDGRGLAASRWTWVVKKVLSCNNEIFNRSPFSLEIFTLEL